MYEYPEYIKIEMSETISQVSLFTRVRLINYYLSPRSQNHDRFINFVLLKERFFASENADLNNLAETPFNISRIHSALKFAAENES